jgi:4-amino-4-deoxy-L-arabinose transferase-like glycosyltransferase
MNVKDRATSPQTVDLSLILHGGHSAESIRRALGKAAVILGGFPRSYEVLVIGDAADAGAGAVREEVGRHCHSRYVESRSPAGFAGILATALAEVRGARIAVADGRLDLQALAYLVPLADQCPLVWGHRRKVSGSLLQRLIWSVSDQVIRRLLDLGTRDWHGGASLAMFHRGALEEVQPECTGTFAAAEVLARARRRGIPVTEITIPAGADGKPLPPAGKSGLLATLADCTRFWWSRVQFAGLPPAPAGLASWGWGLLLAILAALILFPQLDQPLLDPDEGRQAEIPREMLAHHDWLLPRMLGEPYYEKPPLQYWLTEAAYRTLGLHSWCARLVPASAAWFAVLLTFAWARRTLGSRPAFLGGLGLCLTPGFVVLGRTVVLDSLLALCVIASWYAAYLAVAGPALRWRWWLVSAVACGLGILTKGPVALVLLLVPVLGFQLLTPTAARPRWRAWAAYLGIALALAGPWYILMAIRDPDYLRQFLWRANLVRFLNAYDHEQPFWFYLPVLFVATLPWSFLWPALAYFLAGRSPRLTMLRSPALGFVSLTATSCILFYSLAGCKSPPYMAPALAPLALLLGACMDAVLFYSAGRRESFLEFARQLLPVRLAVFVLTLSAGCYLTTSFLGWQAWGWAAIKAGTSLAVLAAWWGYSRWARPALAWGVCAAVVLAFITVAMRDLMVGYASRHSPAPVAKLLRELPETRRKPVISYGRQWNSASFYLRREVVCSYDEHHRQQLIDFLTKKPKTLVLVESGPPLQEFLATLPHTLKTEVHYPQKEGQAALVIVRSGKVEGLAQGNAQVPSTNDQGMTKHQ